MPQLLNQLLVQVQRRQRLLGGRPAKEVDEGRYLVQLDLDESLLLVILQNLLQILRDELWLLSQKCSVKNILVMLI